MITVRGFIRRLLRVVQISATAVLGLILLWSVLVFINFNRERRLCVALENGAMLGYKAVFDLSRPFFKPFVVPKLPGGEPVVDDDLWGITVTPTTIYGVELPTVLPNARTWGRRWRTKIGRPTSVSSQRPAALSTTAMVDGPSSVVIRTGTTAPRSSWTIWSRNGASSGSIAGPSW